MSSRADAWIPVLAGFQYGVVPPEIPTIGIGRLPDAPVGHDLVAEVVDAAAQGTPREDRDALAGIQQVVVPTASQARPWRRNEVSPPGGRGTRWEGHPTSRPLTNRPLTGRPRPPVQSAPAPAWGQRTRTPRWWRASCRRSSTSARRRGRSAGCGPRTAGLPSWRRR